MDNEIRHPMTFDALQALLPDAAIEENRNGELIVYTGWRLDPQNREGPLLPHECPDCDGDDPYDNDKDCESKWHVDNRLTVVQLGQHSDAPDEAETADHTTARKPKPKRRRFSTGRRGDDRPR